MRSRSGANDELPERGAAGRAEPEGQWARKKRATRLALQQTALRLVAERGLEKVTIDEISSAAGVSTRTFANYFSSKEDALTAEGPWLLDRRILDEFVLGGLSSDLLSSLRSVLSHSVEQAAGRWEEMHQRRLLVEQYPRLMSLMLGRFAALEDTMTAAIAQRARMDAQRDVYPRLVAAVAMTALRVAFLRWTEQDGKRSLEQHLDEVFAVLSKGL
jgi:AcrR family transcriptional regulator